MADELMTMRKGTRATRVAELQSEVFTSQIEMERLLEINRVRRRRGRRPRLQRWGADKETLTTHHSSSLPKPQSTVGLS